MMERKQRCGICNHEVEGDFMEHVRSEEHQRNLHDPEKIKDVIRRYLEGLRVRK